MNPTYYSRKQLNTAQNYLGTTRKLLAGWLGITIEDYLQTENGHTPLPPKAKERLSAHLNILGDFLAIIRDGRTGTSDPKPMILSIQNFEEFVGIEDPDLDALTRLYKLFGQATRFAFDFTHIIVTDDLYLEDYRPILALTLRDIETLDFPSWMLEIRSYCQDVLTDPETVELISKGGAKNG